MPVVATGVVVDAIAVANVEAVLGAVPPDRALHEPRKRRREGRIELASIDVGREETENVSASARPVAPARRTDGRRQSRRRIPVRCRKLWTRVSTATKVAPTSTPQRPLLAGAQQQGRQRHRQDLVGNAVDVAQRTDDGLATGPQADPETWGSTVPNC